MTELDFRRDQALRGRLVEILADPVMEMALVLLKDGVPVVDAPSASDPIVSVRLLSAAAARQQVIGDLVGLTLPIPEPPVEEEATWGTDEQPRK